MNLPKNPARLRNLVISPIGDGSVHDSWFSDRDARTFDTLLINYGPNPGFGRDEADIYIERKGFKWELLYHAISEHRAAIDSYDRIWLPDADVRADTATVNRLFATFEQHHLQLAQPAICAGEVSYEFLRPRPGVVLRYTPYVECMCPLFTREGLLTILPTFLENKSGWGIDFVWPRYFARQQMAIVDSVGVEHTGRLFRGEHYQKLAKLGIEPQKDFDACVAKYGGFDKRLHKKLVRGTIRLPAVWEPARRPSRLARLRETLGLSPAYA
jgi:hypothetical protein